jgi:dynein intermediate chain
VQRSPLSAQGHTHPVYSLQSVGSKNAHSLVSASTDGKVCLWGTGQLGSPTDSLVLKHTPSDSGLGGASAASATSRERTVDVAVTAMTFPNNDFNEMCVGAEDGSIFRAQIHGSKAGVTSQHRSHFGPVSSMQVRENR